MLRIKPWIMRVLLLAAVGTGTASAAEKKPRTDLYGDPLPPGALARLGTIRLRHRAATIAYSADGKTLLSFSRGDKTIRQWDPATGRERRRILLQGAERITPS